MAGNKIKYGDIFALGRHRLMCGDATNQSDVAKLIGDAKMNLVLTDPPYGIRSVDSKTHTIGRGGRVYPECIGDINSDMAEENYRIIRMYCNNKIIFGGQNFTKFLPPSNGWIYWDKCKSEYNYSFSDGELAWCNCSTKIKQYKFKWNGFCTEGNRELNARMHPNQKPVELFARILEDYSNENENVLDCFAGSGTTLIACEVTNRTCYAMEISPEYCAIIIERFKNITMQGAERLN